MPIKIHRIDKVSRQTGGWYTRIYFEHNEESITRLDNLNKFYRQFIPEILVNLKLDPKTSVRWVKSTSSFSIEVEGGAQDVHVTIGEVAEEGPTNQELYHQIDRIRPMRWR